MIQRISFLISFACILAGLGWWSRHIPFISSPTGSSVQLGSQENRRIELIETLDRIVECQTNYRLTYGRYTQFLNRIGFDIPPWISSLYEIKVSEASEDSLLIVAQAEAGSGSADFISIDQSYKVRANFKIPLPRIDFLRAKALGHLSKLKDVMASQGDPPAMAETGVFKGYFRYQAQKQSLIPRFVVRAVGVKEPVLGVQFELSALQTEGSRGFSLSRQAFDGSIGEVDSGPFRRHDFAHGKKFDGAIETYVKSGLELIHSVQTALESLSSPSRGLSSSGGPTEAKAQSKAESSKPRLHQGSGYESKLVIEPISSRQRD